MTKPFNEETRNLLRSLNHPIRWKIVGQLAGGGQLSPAMISRAIEEPIGNVSYHMRMLLDRKHVQLVDTRQRRGAIEHFYTLTPEVRAQAETLRGLLDTFVVAA